LLWAWATHNNYLSSFAYWTDRPIWNTEPHPISFREDAEMCLDNLAAGASAWFDFADVDSVKNGVCTYAGTADAACLKGGSYRALKMFARYVRPGAVRIASTGTSGSYRVIAFYHPLDTCLTIVLINSSAAATTATLSVTGSYLPPQLNVFQSSAAQDEAPLGQVAINGTVALPAVSVTTLVSGRYTGTGATAVARATMAAPSARARTSGVVRLYALNGRLAATSRGAAVQWLAPGVYCTQAAWGGSARSLQVRGLAP
jgi:hypothetical protein